MLGKNRITTIENLEPLRKLDVLDLHSNRITKVQRMSHLIELRVLNLAGNSVTIVDNLSGLRSLTELNLRRNSIERVLDLDSLPQLQRVFLSHNQIRNYDSIACVFRCVRTLTELALSENPISTYAVDAVDAVDAADSADSTDAADAVGGDDIASGIGNGRKGDFWAEYKATVIGSLPKLTHLDLTRITEDDKRDAKSRREMRVSEERHLEQKRRISSQREVTLHRIQTQWHQAVALDSKSGGLKNSNNTNSSLTNTSHNNNNNNNNTNGSKVGKCFVVKSFERAGSLVLWLCVFFFSSMKVFSLSLTHISLTLNSF